MQTPLFEPTGVFTYGNTINVPPGSLLICKNYVLRKPKLLELRRGMPTVAGSGIASGDAKAIFNYGNALVCHNGTQYHTSADGGTTWSALTGSFAAVSATVQFHGVEANQNFYLTTSTGVQRLVNTTAPVAAGMFSALDVKVTQVAGTSGFQAPNSQVAYRSVWGVVDGNNNVIKGAPSGRSIVVSPSAAVAAAGMVRAANVVTVTIPAGHPFATGETVLYGPGETNFPPNTAGYVLTGTTATTFTYAEVAANATSVLPQTFTYTTRNTKVETTIPASATTSHFCQVYRTIASAASSIEADDECYLVWEGSPPADQTNVSLTRAANVTTGTCTGACPFVVGQTIDLTVSGNAAFPIKRGIVISTVAGTTFTYADVAANAGPFAGNTFHAVTLMVSTGTTVSDTVPEALLGAALYTNPSQEGILQANAPPPLSWDLELFKDCVFYANAQQKQRTSFTLLSVNAPGGDYLQVGDTITIAGTTYTAAAAESATTGAFLLDVSSASAALNVQSTAASLIRVINRYVTNTRIDAFYASADNDVPGQVLVQDRAFGGAVFTVTCSRAGALNPAGTISSTAESKPNAVFFSKTKQPDAVPLTNFRLVGAANKNILRIKATRDTLFVFKEDGVFRIAGTGPEDFRVEPFNSAIRCICPESVALLSNRLYVLTTQGVTAVSDASSVNVSIPIQDVFTTTGLDQTTWSTAATRGFGFGYESEHEYWLMSKAFSPNGFVRWWVYNTETNAWYAGHVFTRNGADSGFSNDTPQCGLVSVFSNVLCLGVANKTNIRRELKSYHYSDYYDDTENITISSVTGDAGAGTAAVGNTYSIAWTGSQNLSAGDALAQGPTSPGSETALATVVSCDNSARTAVLVSRYATLATGTAAVFFATGQSLIGAVTPVLGVSPLRINQFVEVSWFVGSGFGAATSARANNANDVPYTVALTYDAAMMGPNSISGSSNPRPAVSSAVVRDTFPRDAAQAYSLRLLYQATEAYAGLSVRGLSVVYEPISTKGAR